jgi:murein L,D-transpeptidase YcbB/YkuD
MGEVSVKSVRTDDLAAAIAVFGVILGLAVSPANAQQAETEQQIEAAVPVPDTTLPPPLTAGDVGPVTGTVTADDMPATAKPAEAATAATPATEPKAEPAVEPSATPTQDATAPASEPTQDATAPIADPAKTASAPAAAPSSPEANELRELINGPRLARIVSRKADRDGVEAFYKARDYQPLWVSDGAANARAEAAMTYLGRVETVGLDSRDYPTPDFHTAMTPEELAAGELKLTNSVLTYARHAQIGRIHYTRVAGDIFFKLDAPEPATVLAKLADTEDTAAALDSYNPPQAGFKALEKKLAELRAGQAAAKDEEKPKQVRVPEGHTLRPGMKDERVIALRKRLEIGDTDNPLYDEAVVEAVKAFQMQADIGVDGMVGPRTLRALNGTQEAHRRPADPIDTILVNMERWRWLPRKLGNADNDYVVVNVPDYTLTLMHHGKPYWKTKIVVGKPGKATPMISAEMKYITVNPTWNVPPSIIENEYLPALQEDPMALDRIGLKLEQAPDGTVRIYQPPGAGNALGRLRFNFPNKFLVYQHDTPDKYLFKRAKRAYSHGCMRVQDPVEYAVKLLSIELPKQNYTPAKIQSMYGPSEINIAFPNPIPVHLTYQTAFVDQDGKLQFRDDVYGRDARMIAILHGSEMKVADIAISRPPDTSAKPVRMPVGTFADDGYRGYGGGYGGGPTFFDWLFGGAPRQAAPQPYYRPRGFIGPRASNTGRNYYDGRHSWR